MACTSWPGRQTLTISQLAALEAKRRLLNRQNRLHTKATTRLRPCFKLAANGRDAFTHARKAIPVTILPRHGVLALTVSHFKGYLIVLVTNSHLYMRMRCVAHR